MGALGHSYGPVKMGQRQLECLKRAQAACPDSERLRAWPNTMKGLRDPKWGKYGHPSLEDSIPNEFEAIYKNYNITW